MAVDLEAVFRPRDEAAFLVIVAVAIVVRFFISLFCCKDSAEKRDLKTLPSFFLRCPGNKNAPRAFGGGESGVKSIDFRFGDLQLSANGESGWLQNVRMQRHYRLPPVGGVHNHRMAALLPSRKFAAARLQVL